MTEAEKAIVGQLGLELISFTFNAIKAARARGVDLEALLSKAQEENRTTLADRIAQLGGAPEAARAELEARGEDPGPYYKPLVDIPPYGEVEVGSKIHKVKTDNPERFPAGFYYWITKPGETQYVLPPGAEYIGKVSQ